MYLVREVEQNVALLLRAVMLELNGIELKRQIVAESAVEAELGIILISEEVTNRTHHREERGL